MFQRLSQHEPSDWSSSVKPGHHEILASALSVRTCFTMDKPFTTVLNVVSPAIILCILLMAISRLLVSCIAFIEADIGHGVGLGVALNVCLRVGMEVGADVELDHVGGKIFLIGGGVGTVLIVQVLQLIPCFFAQYGNDLQQKSARHFCSDTGV